MRIIHLLLGLTIALPVIARADDEKAAGKLDDRQIATIALTAHDIDIHRAEQALMKTRNEEVKQFAQQMKDDHEAGKKEAVALATRLGVKVKDSDVSKSLKEDAQATDKGSRSLRARTSTSTTSTSR